ncbi:MAG: GNAT family N-acetyltransferase [Rhizobiaceae bacterium]|nr:GNAT family N-acetyltransferase [Rhizobiaceae bacterium]
MKIIIRPAKPHEAKALSDLSMRSKRSNGYDDSFMDACSEELTITENQLSSGEYWVADAGAICGCVNLSPDKTDKTTGEINTFFIDLEWQRKGIGRLLWAKILEQAEQTGLSKLTLDADPFAVPFYEALGFEIVGENPSGSIPGRVLPRMSFSLNVQPAD